MIICAILAIVDKMLFFFPQTILSAVAYMSAATHFENIAKGIVDSRDLVYFLSVIFIGLYATQLVMQEKK
jgi:ABC-2 type transport system permease protein